MEKIDFLKKIPAINSLSGKTLEKIAQVMEKREAAAGEILFSEGDPSDNLCIIESGEAVISKKLAEGAEKTLSVIGGNAIVGEMSLFTDRARTANVRAKTALSYWKVPSALLKSAVSEDAGGMLKMTEALLLYALDRLEHTSRELATVYEISKTIAKNLTIEEFCAEIILQLRNAVPDVDTVSFYVWNEFTEEYESPGNKPLSKDHSLISNASQKSESIQLSEAESAALPGDISNAKCALLTPVGSGKLKALLLLGNSGRCVNYPRSTFDLMNSVAIQLSEAIDNIKARQEAVARQRFERTRSGSINW